HLHQCLVASCFGRGPATYEIYPLSLHDALPIWRRCLAHRTTVVVAAAGALLAAALTAVLPLIVRHVVDETTSGAASVLPWALARSEEHTSELQSRENLVCRLLLEKKKMQTKTPQ